MPEYRRFVAYFYEYIDGKKQKNAGYAKVELRNGMWRVLFRLTVPVPPEPPVQVYGFVREQAYLLGFPLGTINSGQAGPEEWAWRTDAPVGQGKYLFEQLTGIRMQSGDGRIFITVWDNEEMDPDRFVLELPVQDNFSRQPEKPGVPEQIPSEDCESMEPAFSEGSGTSEPRLPEAPGFLKLTFPESPVSPEPQTTGAPEVPEQAPRERPEVPGQNPCERPEAPGQNPRECPELPGQYPAEQSELQISEMPERTITEMRKTPEDSIPARMSKWKLPSEERKRGRMGMVKPFDPDSIQGKRNQMDHLLHERQRFRPFQDDEFTDCVQIKLCDILPLQQENWQVGRSNFLQHGYYLYRHLLLGRAKDGCYVLGVPGMRTLQEEYMAHTFGYDHFKMSELRGCGRRFGYWYRILREPENTSADDRVLAAEHGRT